MPSKKYLESISRGKIDAMIADMERAEPSNRRDVLLKQLKHYRDVNQYIEAIPDRELGSVDKSKPCSNCNRRKRNAVRNGDK